MYFIGVTTAKSSINTIFPLWAERLELGSCQLKGIDFKLHDEPELYRTAVEFIKDDPHSLGALVTTHKIDLCNACRDLFDALDPLSDSMNEVSSIFKRVGKLHGRAVDPISSGLALEAFLPRDHWERTNAEVFILGAGGSAVALTWYLVQLRHRANRPARVHVADPSRPRLDHLQELHGSWGSGSPLECHVVDVPGAADAILESLKPSSLIVNATGLGKDAPGSPITDEAYVSGELAGLGIQLSRRLDISTPGESAAGSEEPDHRGWLDLFRPWVDACDCRRLRGGHSDAGT